MIVHRQCPHEPASESILNIDPHLRKLLPKSSVSVSEHGVGYYTVSKKNWATFIFTVTMANVGRF